MPSLIFQIISWPMFAIALFVFGFAPGTVLRLIVLLFPRDHPRRRELLGELYAVPRIERPFWVVEKLEVALFEGLRSRFATRRRAALVKQADIPVAVNVYDFIGNKTGIFGTIRTGKSSTMKAVAARVFAVSEHRRTAGQPPIGQLIFDPLGEYTNHNTQDGAELAAIGVDHVVIYKFGEAQDDQPNVHRLGVNPDVDFRYEIYQELLQGRIVIVDLHLGLRPVITKLAREMVGYLMERQTERLTSGEDPPPIQVMIDEAHSLFSSDRFKNEYDVWVRLAKEGRKLRIGMIYATQDVTEVADQVLANTKNWVVADAHKPDQLGTIA
jgi:DNA helicase HerA-like ATPase